MPRFVDAKFNADSRYAVGHDQSTGVAYLSIPVRNSMVEYEEYYAIDPQRFAVLANDDAAATAFAEECRARLHDDLLILKPGRERGFPL